MYDLTVTVTTGQERFELFLTERSEESFRLLCDAISPRLMRYFRARSCDQLTAEELTQDVLFALHRKAQSIRDPKLFHAWLFQIAHNALLQRVRAASRRISIVGEDEAPPGVWQSAIHTGWPDSKLSSDLDSALASLDLQDHEILLLRFVDGLDYKEISAMLKIPVGTAKWRVFNSKLKLAAKLRNGGKKQ